MLDTSVVVDLENIDPELLPVESAIAAITLAELAAGPHATSDRVESARRQDRLQRVERVFDALPFDDAAARAYGRLYALERARGRKARGTRMADLMIAATAAAASLPVFTRNPSDLAGLGEFVEVIAVE
ncbi:MAG: type II toxin-antitoxin system VapC family toxin [Marmoricola sp.]